jgi:NADPH:quinone reductase-like Zn-dependent oxidoreductase
MSKMMKAALFYECGGADKIRVAEVPVPEIGADEVLVRVQACALNHLDLWKLQGPAPDGSAFPFWTGSDIAGVIAEVGGGVSGFAPGERVVVNPILYCGKCEFCIAGEESMCTTFGILGSARVGGNAEFVAVKASALTRMPDGFDFVTAAAAPLSCQTAWRALVTRARVRPGEDVLVLGASGGTAAAAVQIAKLAGARVFAVTSSPDKVKKALAIGADTAFDRTASDPFEEVGKITDGRGVDVVVENVGAATWPQSQTVLRNGGRLVTYGRTTGRIGQTDIWHLFWHQTALIGSTMANRREFAAVMKLVFEGKIKPVVDSVFPLARAGEAFARLERGEQFGKVVIKIAE